MTIAGKERRLSGLLGRRDLDALYFKPLCVFAVCELINEGKLTATRIGVARVLDRFDELVSLVIPGAEGKGYQPFWHLGTPGFWQLFSDSGELVVGSHFKSKNRPRSRKQLEDAVSYAVPNSEISKRLAKKSSRNSLMSDLIKLLQSEDDISCCAVAAVLDERLHSGEFTAETTKQVAAETEEFPEYTVEDYSKLRLHKRVDRSSSRKVKALLGHICQMCNVDLEQVYGSVGRGYVEAHHLRPIAQNTGLRVTLDIRKDFVVLCANCHRMIHRAKLPDSIDEYVQAYGKPRLRN